MQTVAGVAAFLASVAVVLAALGAVMAPFAPWSSDRSTTRFRIKVLGRRGVRPA